MAERLTTNYTRTADGQFKVEDPDRVASKLISGPQVFYSASGGLYSTLRDYVKFCVMVMNNGVYKNVQIAKPETIA
jgi:CubicO group peptidase (beta-lactamase class C family)